MLKDFIKRKRDALGLTQAELGKKAGVSAQMVSLWEDGSVPKAEHLITLAKALDSDLEHIVRLAARTAA